MPNSVARPKVRIRIDVELRYTVFEPGADFVFNIHAAHTECQRPENERLVINASIVPQMFAVTVTGNRYMRLRAPPGPLNVAYGVEVALMHHRADPAQLHEVPVCDLPPNVMGYLHPSRYCQSDRLTALVGNEFGSLAHGYSRVEAIRDWVHSRISFKSNTSNSNTSALDTLIDRVGVCRDFAHVMIAMCRACCIPARLATGTDYGADPALGPPDFHAYVEVYVGGRWYLFDPSGTAIPMGFVRFGTGRDAADVAFATIFGPIKAEPPIISAVALQDASQGIVLPHHCAEALSTDAGPPAMGHR